jgi:uncharacterized membrane protein YbaN (DUF454 family)
MVVSRTDQGDFVPRATAGVGKEPGRNAQDSRARRNPGTTPTAHAQGVGKTLGRSRKRPGDVTTVTDRTALEARDWTPTPPTMIPLTDSPPLGVPPASRFETAAGLRLDCREDCGLVVVHDPRLLRPGREAFCRALVREAVGQGGALRAEVVLATSDFRLEFATGRFDRAGLAEQVALAVRAATPSARDLAPSRDAWLTLTAFPAGGEPSVWETLEGRTGRVVLRHRALIDAPWLAVRLARALRGLPGVRTCLAHPWSGRLEVDVDAETAPPAVVVAAAESALRKELPASRPYAGTPSTFPVMPQEPPFVEPGARRLVDLVLAGGSFTMAVAGFVVPGVPSAPFVVLASHYLVRSAPKTHQRLSRLPGVGPVLQRTGRAGHPWADRRAFLKTLGWSVLTAAAFLIVHPPLPVVLALEFGLLTLSGAHG